MEIRRLLSLIIISVSLLSSMPLPDWTSFSSLNAQYLPPQDLCTCCPFFLEFSLHSIAPSPG